MFNFLIPYINIIRPKHVVKNFIIFLPLIFSENFLNTSLLLNSIYAFLIFCILSFNVYVFNDILDYKKDSLHPQKKNRPLSSGKISRLSAIYYLTFLLIIFLVLTLKFNKIFEFSIIYLFLNIL